MILFSSSRVNLVLEIFLVLRPFSRLRRQFWNYFYCKLMHYTRLALTLVVGLNELSSIQFYDGDSSFFESFFGSQKKLTNVVSG